MKKLMLLTVFVFCTSFVEKTEEVKESVLPIKEQTELDLLRIQRNKSRVLLSKKMLQYVEAEERLSKAIN